MKRFLTLSFSLLLFVALPGCSVLKMVGLYTPPASEYIGTLRADVAAQRVGMTLPAGTRVDSVRADSSARVVHVRFSGALADMAFREQTVRSLHDIVSSYLAEAYPGFTFSVETLRRPVEELVPNYFRPDTATWDRSRMPKGPDVRPAPVVRNLSKPFVPTKGLFGRNVGIWNSHGWYYNNDLNRWEWQRPRLFLTVEDLVPTAFVLPYIVPMLEHAGANVFVPRERDLQTHEVVVDNDTQGSGYVEHATDAARWSTAPAKGFAVGTPPYGVGVNPFQLGTVRMAPASGPGDATARWSPDIPADGAYAVYVSYASVDSGTSDARYTVHHLGGSTEFRVNQQIGGGTWIYLGTFRFQQGRNDAIGSVELASGAVESGRYLTADAVRFGGGMGVIERGGTTSGRPKFVEGSRYWLQYAGMPDTLVYSFSRGRNDYRDDYMSRAEYLNYLMGAPFGPNRDRGVKGLGIPIDISMAFHTDAGITTNDTTVGTLSIYGLESTDESQVFPDSMSRMASRDLADIIQTQIVNDTRASFDPAWNRRQLRNGDYSEARRPNMPGLLLELLSHQNFLDMEFALDPRFRFEVSRAIYKGMLRFLSAQYRVPYVVEPLAPVAFSSEFSSTGDVVLRWKPQADPLEPTALPQKYIVYTRKDDGGFDNGFVVDTAGAVIRTIVPGVIYSFKVSAVNDGGESFPSEVLAVCRASDSAHTALIVNGFDRISGPGTVNVPGYEGFTADLDAGVPDHVNPGMTGDQYDFDRSSAFRSNDAPGHGASFADLEGHPIAGNTFDFAVVHGRALRAAGWSFVSVSRQAVMDSAVSLSSYPFVDLILGKEKETHWQRPALDSIRGVQYRVFPALLQASIAAYLRGGGNLLASGAYVGADLFAHPKTDSISVQFARSVLHFNWVTNHAARTGDVFNSDTTFLPRGTEFRFNQQPSSGLYAVESPDALVPADSGAQLLRYSENQFGAGVGYKQACGVIVMGFPIETMPDANARTLLMQAVLRYLHP